MLELAPSRFLQSEQRVLLTLEMDEGKGQLACMGCGDVHLPHASKVGEHLAQISSSQRDINALRLHPYRSRVHIGQSSRSNYMSTTLPAALRTPTPITAGAGSAPSLAVRSARVSAFVNLVNIAVICLVVAVW